MPTRNMTYTRERPQLSAVDFAFDVDVAPVSRSRLLLLLRTSTTTILLAILARALFADGIDAKPEVEAIRSMRARGIGNPSELLEHAGPAAILATCRWYDTLKGVGPGLLASKIRQGGVEVEDQEDTKAGRGRRNRERRAQFDEYVRRFPEGSIVESHARLEERPAAIFANDDHSEPRPYTPPPAADRCVGSIIVLAANYPLIEVRCDTCGYEAAYPFRARTELPATAAATGRPEPEPHPVAPIPLPASEGRPGGLRRHPIVPPAQLDSESPRSSQPDSDARYSEPSSTERSDRVAP
jgi:hypothetical protein